MSAPPFCEQPQSDAADSRSRAVSHDSDGLRALLRSARGTAMLLATHSAAAQSLVTTDEDAVDALVTCCALLLRELDVGLDVAMNSIRVLAELADNAQTSWRDLARLRERPLSAALAGCDEHLTQQLRTIAEVLQFPKLVSLLLQRQLAVFRIRRDAAPGDSATAKRVRAEAVLAPLLERAAGFVAKHVVFDAGWPSDLALTDTPAFWRGFFGDSEDPESLDTGRRELDHLAYGAGQLLGDRGLLPDLLQAPTPNCSRYVNILADVAAVVGDVATLAALYHAGRPVDLPHIASLAAQAGQVEVIRLVLALGCDLPADDSLLAAAAADLSSDTRLQILSLFRGDDLGSMGPVLLALARCGDVQCVQRLLRLCRFGQRYLDDAVALAAAGGHIPIMTVLLDHGACLGAEAFQDSARVAVLQWCAERRCSVDADFFKAAAVGGRVFQLEWAASVIDVSSLLTAEVFASAAGGGSIPSMEWLLARRCPWDARVLNMACGAGRTKFAVAALRHGCPLDENAVETLAKTLPLDALKEAVQALRDSGRGEVVTLAALFCGASCAGNVEVAEWLVCDLGFPISADDCTMWHSLPLGDFASDRGCLRLLQHLHSKGWHVLGPGDMRAAIAQSQQAGLRATRSIETVRWLHAQGVTTHGAESDHGRALPLPHHPAVDATDFLTFQAARCGALEMLRVLVEECGAHWTESACAAAAEMGHVKVLQWALSKHCPCAADTWCAAVRRAGQSNDYRPLALLLSAKCPWNEAMWAAAAPHEEVQAWLKERGCPGSQAAPAAGAGAGVASAAPAAAAGAVDGAGVGAVLS